MRITILAHGSRGDVQPYVGLGVGLKKAGHTVRLAAPEMFRDFVQSYGVEFMPLAGNPSQLMQTAVEQAGGQANLLQISRVMLKYALPIAEQVMADTYRACAGTDVIIHSFLTTVVGHLLAHQLGCRDFSALLFPVFQSSAAFPNPSFPELPLGPVYNRLTHRVFNQVFQQTNRLCYAWLRRRLPDWPRRFSWPFAASNKPPTPVFYGFSSHVVPKPSDWNEHVHVTGYWFLDAPSTWQPSPELTKFLSSGSPPVYIGFGSVITSEAKRLADIALKTLAETGQRGVLLTGWGGLELGNLPDYVFRVDAVPFDWLFPRMLTVVHHGGIGTTAAALRAGIPSVVIPFTADQPFWGQRVCQLGVGPEPIPSHRLTADRLIAALRTTIQDPAMRQRAASLGESLRAEDGVNNTVEIVERYLMNTPAR